MNPALVPVWVILALTTLLLVVNDGNPLLAALTAWCGGVITCLLGQSLLCRRATR